MKVEPQDKAPLHLGGCGPAASGSDSDLCHARSRVTTCIEAASRLQRDLRETLPDAAQCLDLALGDLLDAYDLIELVIGTTPTLSRPR